MKPAAALLALLLAQGSKPSPPSPHFPDRLHAFVWRNWELVPPDRLAEVVAAKPEEILDLGESMGLPDPPAISADQRRRSYITVFAPYGDPLLDKEADPYPEGYLARLAQSGVDAVYPPEIFAAPLMKVAEGFERAAPGLPLHRDQRILEACALHFRYYYMPLDLVEKVLNCRDLLDRWLPGERKK